MVVVHELRMRMLAARSHMEVGQARKEFEMDRLSNGLDNEDNTLLDGDYPTSQFRMRKEWRPGYRMNILKLDNRVFVRLHTGCPSPWIRHLIPVMRLSDNKRGKLSSSRMSSSIHDIDDIRIRLKSCTLTLFILCRVIIT